MTCEWLQRWSSPYGDPSRKQTCSCSCDCDFWVEAWQGYECTICYRYMCGACIFSALDDDLLPTVEQRDMSHPVCHQCAASRYSKQHQLFGAHLRAFWDMHVQEYGVGPRPVRAPPGFDASLHPGLPPHALASRPRLIPWWECLRGPEDPVNMEGGTDFSQLSAASRPAGGARSRSPHPLGRQLLGGAVTPSPRSPASEPGHASGQQPSAGT